VLHAKDHSGSSAGHVGRHVAKIANAFEMRVLAWSPRLTDQAALAVEAKRRELDDLLRESDVVSIHLTLSPESRGLLNAARIGLMKPTAYLINTARGPIVDEAALIAALAEGRIAGAGLDVFENEPMPFDHPLTKLPNLVLTPHLVGLPTRPTPALQTPRLTCCWPTWMARMYRASRRVTDLSRPGHAMPTAKRTNRCVAPTVLQRPERSGR